RVTFGLPFFLAAPLFVPKLWARRRFLQLGGLLLPLLVGGCFYVLLGYARFGTPVGVDFNAYINPAHRDFLRQHHIFELRRVPFGVADYFGLRFPRVEQRAPYLRGE